MEQYLHCFVCNDPKKWARYLAWAKYLYNTTYHRIIGMTPFEAVFGRKPPVLLSYEGGSAVNEVDRELRTRDGILRQLKANMKSAVNIMKQYADANRREV